MISVLIPTYKYDTLELVCSLHMQLLSCAIPFEVICFDDGSPEEYTRVNKKINTLSNCRYEVLEKNIGRSAIRNLLAEKAQYPQLLFLDADTKVLATTFIQKYLDHLHLNRGVIYGGIVYQKTAPNKDQLLRWKYGNKREALTVDQRSQDPHITLLTLNFLIKKELILKVPFDESIPNLRHEDTLFALNLQQQNTPILHIENPVIHLGLETSISFLKKSLESVEVLHFFQNKNLIRSKDIKLTRIASKLENMKLHYFIILLYKMSKAFVKNNLTSAYPNLLLFDFYRLGYYFVSKKSFRP